MADQDEPRKITARLVRQGPDEREFDAHFWSTIPPERRVEMLWEMVLEARALRGESGDEPRLQRSVLHVRRL